MEIQEQWAPGEKSVKKIILLSDGTGNSRAKIWKSNVWRLYKALDLSPEHKQVAFYDDGVGTSSTKVLAALGGIFGFGLARNVRELYSFLCRTYSDGDEIYIFGFSRGAFTARVLAGFVCSQGIVKYTGNDKELRKSVHSAYKAFRRAAFGRAVLQRPIQWFSDGWDYVTGKTDPNYKLKKNLRHPKKRQPDDKLIHFMGLWDTVDAYGGPIDELTSAFNRLVWPLRAADRDISPRIRRVCQALALDEQRQSFEPMLINEKVDNCNGDEHENIDEERITQVWFNGVHSDVGGGYPDSGLALVTLKWMMERCNRKSGNELEFIDQERERLFAGADHTAKLNDSRAGFGVFYRYDPRDLDKLCCDERYGWRGRILKVFGSKDVKPDEVCIDLPKIHHTVFDRIRSRSSLFVPFNVPKEYAVVSENGDIHEVRQLDSDRKSDGEAPDVDEHSSGTTEKDWPFETDEQARKRVKRQKVLWNKVWFGRVLYYLTVLTIVAFLAVPFVNLDFVNPDSGRIAKLEQSVTAGLGTSTKVLEKIPGAVQQLVSVLPGSDNLSPLFDYYSGAPVFFVAFFIVIGAFLILGGLQRRALYNQMGLVWGTLRHPDRTKKFSPACWRRTVARWHWSPTYRRIKELLRFLAEVLAGAVVIYIVIVIVSRIFLFATDALGGVCDPTAEAKLKTVTTDLEVFEFRPTNPCLATGLKLSKDATYRIVLETKVASQSQRQALSALQAAGGDSDTSDPKWKEIKRQNFWSDATIISDLTGWQESRWYMPFFVPFRRHLFVDWYQPVARIGHRWFFRGSLIPPQDKLKQNSDEARLRSEAGGDQAAPLDLTLMQRVESKLTASKDGELFLYLNDAVVLHPRWIPNFYDNNLGVARVTIKRVENIKPVN